MPESSRHHYIPQFYLKGFTNRGGKLAVYDKKKMKLKRGYFSPKSHFFEFDRNMLIVDGISTSFLEDLYQHYDGSLSTLFRLFRENLEDKNILNAQNIMNLKLFIAMMFWRIPESDKYVNKFFRGINFNNLGLRIIDKNTGGEAPDKIKEKYFNDSNFRESCRFLILPLSTFRVLLQDSDINNWRYYYSESEALHLCSDNPIIFKNPLKFFTFEDDLILPLTSLKTLIFTRSKKSPSLPPEFKISLDLNVFHQATTYVCGPNRSYLEHISNLYDYKKNVDGNYLKNELFSFLNPLTSQST